jgi:hypothetical protein
VPQQQSGCVRTENISQQYICNSCYPETSVGEVVSPKEARQNNLVNY